MGKRAETIAASGGGSENNEFDSCQAHHVGIFPQEDRGDTAGEVGKDTGCEEESGLVAWGACCGYAVGFRASSQLQSAPVDPHKQKRGTL
jgi:hypothetical protein